MAFDDATRGRLQKFVGDARSLLTAEFAKQFQQEYGLDPESGAIASLESLPRQNDRRLEIARLLREIFDHYLASGGTSGSDTRKAVLARMVREQAFTTLNRLAALRMMEARGIVLETVSKGYLSKGFQLYQHVAGPSIGDTGDTYRWFLLSVCDMFLGDLPALFDRNSPNGRLFPREPALLALLSLLNAPALNLVWGEDETIGWIYQYFNSPDERKKMRKESSAPRNSRELAVRNQFFTPRYVVEFLVDNTLVRQWFDQMAGRTSLVERCEYLVLKPEELTEDRNAKPRDPRSIKLLDPACGSMHFGLYAFNIFEVIYHEAWAFEEANGAGSLTGENGAAPLTAIYVDQASFRRDVPRLILENNLYGVDIDPRAAQIASLALWLRAQRAWHDAGLKPGDRPVLGRGHVIAAVAPPAEIDLRRALMDRMDPLDAALFEKTLTLLKGLPEMGLMLKVEVELPKLVKQVYGTQTDMWRGGTQSWREIEIRLRRALTEFAQSVDATYQGRLFASDALDGFLLLDVSQQKFDVVVMNPPFGALSKGAKATLSKYYPKSKNDLLAIFVERCIELSNKRARIGIIASRTCFFLSSFQKWREEIVLESAPPVLVADLGYGVMDEAMVEAAAFVLEKLV